MKAKSIHNTIEYRYSILGRFMEEWCSFFEEKETGYKTPCWIWNRKPNTYGYGRSPRYAKENGAHRWFYKMIIGDVDDEIHLDHLCRTRNCVNPYHLDPVPCNINVQRGDLAKLNERKVKLIRYLSSIGISGYALASLFDVSNGLIARVNKRLCWKNVEGEGKRGYGRLGGNVEEIRGLYKSGMSTGEIGKIFGTSYKNIWRICANKRWINTI